MFNIVVDGAVSFLQPTTINISRIVQLLISVALVSLALIATPHLPREVVLQKRPPRELH